MCGLLSTSILVSSCSVGGEYDPYVYKPYHADCELGEDAVKLNLNLKSEDVRYINALVKCSEDIIANPQIAKLAISDKENFLKRYGYEGTLNLNEDLTKIVLALGDETINKAIVAQDYKTLIKLFKEKDLLTATQKCILNTPEYQKQFKKISKKLNLNGKAKATRALIKDPDNIQELATVPILAIAVYVVAVVAIGMVVAYAYAHMKAEVSSVVINSKDMDISALDIVKLKQSTIDYTASNSNIKELTDAIEANKIIDSATKKELNNLLSKIRVNSNKK